VFVKSRRSAVKNDRFWLCPALNYKRQVYCPIALVVSFLLVLDFFKSDYSVKSYWGNNNLRTALRWTFNPATTKTFHKLWQLFLLFLLYHPKCKYCILIFLFFNQPIFLSYFRWMVLDQHTVNLAFTHCKLRMSVHASGRALNTYSWSGRASAVYTGFCMCTRQISGNNTKILIHD